MIGALEIHFQAQFKNGFLLSFELQNAPKSEVFRQAKGERAFFEWLKNYHQLEHLAQWNCLQPKGTDFQLRVWRELFQVPWGARCSYRDLAAKVGKPQAAQAIGQAVGRNPISLFIPCHRVIRSDRTLGGYRWGSLLKTALLKAEKLNNPSWF